MDAEFFVIMPAMNGWDLYHGMKGCGWFARCDDALEPAEMAGARHGAAGVTTAVVVEMRNRDAAVVSVHA